MSAIRMLSTENNRLKASLDELRQAIAPLFTGHPERVYYRLDRYGESTETRSIDDADTVAPLMTVDEWKALENVWRSEV